jgi:hypothetical protein
VLETVSVPVVREVPLTRQIEVPTGKWVSLHPTPPLLSMCGPALESWITCSSHVQYWIHCSHPGKTHSFQGPGGPLKEESNKHSQIVIYGLLPVSDWARKVNN